MNKVVRAGVIPQMVVDWIQDSTRAGHFSSWRHKDQNEFLDTLFSIGNNEEYPSDLRQRASQVYKEVKRVATAQKI